MGFTRSSLQLGFDLTCSGELVNILHPAYAFVLVNKHKHTSGRYYWTWLCPECRFLHQQKRHMFTDQIFPIQNVLKN